jgi:hypothetical protein
MNDDLAKLDDKLSVCDIFTRMTKEKQEELSDAIYMSAVRSSLGIGDVISIARTTSALDEDFFERSQGNIYDFVPDRYRLFAQKLFHKKAGGGTPNAAIGKAELLLLFLSDKTTKPTRGDILFNERQIEIKANGGKLGLGSGEVANKKAVEFCERNQIVLRMGTTGISAREKPVFDPTREDDRSRVGGHLGDVLAAWWEGLSGNAIGGATWPKIRTAFLQQVAQKYLTEPNIELMVFASDGRFRLFKNADELVQYYDVDQSQFEYRAYQKNPFSIYLTVRH